MQTLILNSPVPGPFRPGMPASDTALPVPPTEAFADHLAMAPDEQPPNEPTEPLSVPEVLATASENMPPVWLGHVRDTMDLAESVVMTDSEGDDDLHTVEISSPAAPGDAVLADEAVPATGTSVSKPFGWTQDGLAPSSLSAQSPQGVALATRGSPSPGMASLDHSDHKQFRQADPGLPQTAVIEGVVPPTAGLQVAVGGTTSAGWESLGSKVHGRPDAGSQHLSVNDAALSSGSTDPGAPRAELLRGIAVASSGGDKDNAVLENPDPSFPGSATSTATGAELIWQANLVAEAEQGPAREASAWVQSSPSSPRIPGSSATFLGYMGHAFPAYPAGQDLASGISVLAQPVESDRVTEAEALPIFGSMPTGANVEVGSRHSTAPVSLQDLPRFVSQLAGTLVHRAGGQTEVALSPEELGHVRLSMQADAQNPDRMVVMLTFERPETLDLFRRHADQLADALRAAGYSDADISFGRSGGENAHERTDQDRTGSVARDTDDPTAGIADTQPHQPSCTAITGSLDLRL